MTNNKLYARDEYLKKKAADSNGLNIQLTNNYAFRKTSWKRFSRFAHFLLRMVSPTRNA